MGEESPKVVTVPQPEASNELQQYNPNYYYQTTNEKLLSVQLQPGSAETGNLHQNGPAVDKFYFMQADPTTHAETFKFTEKNFGLIKQQYDTDATLPNTLTNPIDWQRFEHHLDQLNQKATPNVRYVLLILGRHGQGYHNIGEMYYGTHDWDCHFSTLDGSPDGKINWSDAHLTKIGIQQAQDVHDFWVKQIRDQKMSTPQSYYISPFDRAIHTADVTFRDLDHTKGRPYKPLIKELLREMNGEHTCDRRSTKTVIHSRWPEYEIEQGFAENDETWGPIHRETYNALRARLRIALDDIFDHDKSTTISITAHSGTIKVILEIIGHREFPLETGGVVPALVKVEKKEGQRAKEEISLWHFEKCKKKHEEEGEGRRKESIEEFLRKVEGGAVLVKKEGEEKHGMWEFAEEVEVKN